MGPRIDPRPEGPLLLSARDATGLGHAIEPFGSPRKAAHAGRQPGRRADQRVGAIDQSVWTWRMSIWYELLERDSTEEV